MEPLQSIWTIEDIEEIGAVKLDDLKTILLKIYNQYHLPDDIQFIIGTTVGAPDPGTDTYIDTNLVNRRYRVKRNGVGTLILNVHYIQNLSGGFTLLNSSVFNIGEQFTIEFI